MQYIPQNADEILIHPIRSSAIAKGTHFEITRPASPPLLPPQDLSKLNGLWAYPNILFSVWIFIIAYDVFPLTKAIAPALIYCLTTAASSGDSSSQK